MINRNKISAAILAGGESRRFEGVDKGFILFAGKPMVLHAIERVGPQTGAMMLSCNRNLPNYQQALFNYHEKTGLNDNPTAVAPLCLEDSSETKFTGPLAGIHRCLQQCYSDYLFICPCDVPLIPLDIVQRLAREMQQNDYQAVYPASEGRSHPLILLVQANIARNTLNELLNTANHVTKNGRQSGYSVKEWLALIRCGVLKTDNSIAFTNLNSEIELKEAESRVFWNKDCD